VVDVVSDAVLCSVSSLLITTTVGVAQGLRLSLDTSPSMSEQIAEAVRVARRALAGWRWSLEREPRRDLEMNEPVAVTTIMMEPTPSDRVDVLPNLGGSILGVAVVLDRFRHLFRPPKTPLYISDIFLNEK
jgi:hypothetical protein